MMLKTDLHGWLLNSQLLLAFLSGSLPKKWARVTWMTVIPVALAGIAVRWISVGHPPMRNLFEAFLWLPLFLAGATLLSRLRDKLETIRIDAWLGVIIAFPLAFVFSAAESPLPPALQSPFFVPHVLSYMLAYALLARAFCLEFTARQQTVNRLVAWGFFLLTLGLTLGSMWGNEAWGVYWQWDPKEQWSLATWLIYAAFFHLRHHRTARRWLLGLGLLAILLTLTWVNLSKLFPGMHSYAGL